MQKHLSVKALGCLFLLILLLCVNVYAESDISDFSQKIEQMQDKAAELSQKLTFESIYDYFSANAAFYIKQLSKSLGITTAVIIISAVFSSISGEQESSAIFNLIAKCLIIITVFPVITSCFDKASEHIEALCGFMLSFIPTAVLLHTASGNTLSASLLSGTLPSAITLLQIISVGLILPLVKAVFSLSVINMLCKKANLSGITSMLKSVSMWIIGLFFTLFSGLMSLQTLLEASADNLAIKGLKYGAARMIPIAGGLVSESMRTVISAVGFIKNVSGIAGIVFILYTILSPLILLILTKLYLSFLSAISKASGGDAFSSFFDGLNTTMNLILALVISCSISFVILLALFMKTNVTI